MAETYYSLTDIVKLCDNLIAALPPSFYSGIMAVRGGLANIPVADVPLALWTDEPISGTEFMTHIQGHGGFEIHFRTDDNAKCKAVQDGCRRQIGYAKPAADVVPVVRCRDCIFQSHAKRRRVVEQEG